MFEAGPRVKIYIATEPQDMRKSFTGLAKAVSQVVGKNPQICSALQYVAEP